MKSTGVIRRVNEYGQIVIPEQVRRKFGIKKIRLWKISLMEITSLLYLITM